MKTQFSYICLHSDFLEKEEFKNILEKYSSTFETTGGQFLDKGEELSARQLLYFIITGGTENNFLEIYRERRNKFSGEPVFLISHPGNNSLPAALEILARVKQEKTKGRIVYLSGNQENDKQQLTLASRNLNVYKKFSETNIGLIGQPSDWLIASSPESSTVFSTWGIKVKKYDVSQLQKIYHEITDNKIHDDYKTFTNNAKNIFGPGKKELLDSIRIYSAIKTLVHENNLDSVSLRCFDIVTNEKTTGCFALSKLIDEGIIAGCEGDLVSTIGMLWVYFMFAKYPWMANPSRVDLNENRLILAHCTVPRNIVSEYNIRSHFESGIGVGIQGKIEKGPVTILRIGGKDLKSIWLAEGEIINNSYEENLCRTQVEVRLHDRNKLKDLLQNPLGNHLILVHGFHAEELEEWHSDFIL